MMASGSSFATVIGRSLAGSRSVGISGGVVPTVTASKSYQWVDDAAAQVARILRTQEELLRQASLEGAFLTDVYLLTRTDAGRSAGEALVRQAFHGSEDVVTAVMTRHLTHDEQAFIRHHAAAFTPSTRVETVPGLLEGYKDATLLTPLQVAAYTAPGLYEQGPAITTQERIPPFAFFPALRGNVVLAHQWSTETGRLTSATVALSKERHMHTAFIGDTGYGKTVAAERLCLRRRSDGISATSCWISAPAGGACSRRWTGSGWTSGGCTPAPRARCAGTRCRSGNGWRPTGSCGRRRSCSPTPARWGRASWAFCGARCGRCTWTMAC
jgi:hypothetical protein